jgi:hypothetical protein
MQFDIGILFVVIGFQLIVLIHVIELNIKIKITTTLMD